MNILTADQKVPLSARFEDSYGNAASIDGKPRWETSKDGIVSVTPAADGMSAEVVTLGPVGMVQVRAVADAAPGAAERLVIGVCDIEVVGGEARVVTLSVGAAQAKEDAAPPVDEDDDPSPDLPVEPGETPEPV